MPRRLLHFGKWIPLEIERKDARCGDLLFVKNRKHKKLLSHVAMIVGVDRIFHCCPSFGTAIIQSDDAFFSLYKQKLTLKKMLCYIDPRNTKLREAQKGIFIPRKKSKIGLKSTEAGF